MVIRIDRPGNKPPKVVELFPERVELSTAVPKHPYCRHIYATICGRRRELKCKDCGADMDPIDYIARFAKDADWYIHLMKRKKALERAIEDLKRREKNARALVKKWEARASKCGEVE